MEPRHSQLTACRPCAFAWWRQAFGFVGPSAAVTEVVNLRFTFCGLHAVGCWLALSGRRQAVLCPIRRTVRSSSSELAFKLPPTAHDCHPRQSQQQQQQKPHGVGQPPCCWARRRYRRYRRYPRHAYVEGERAGRTRPPTGTDPHSNTRTVSEHPTTLCVVFPFDTDYRSIAVPRRQPANTVVPQST